MARGRPCLHSASMVQAYLSLLPCSLAVILWYWPPMLWVALMAVLAGIYHQYLEPIGAPKIIEQTYLYLPFYLSSFALSLLLVFRGQLLNITRNLVRIGLTWGSQDEALQQLLARWTTAMPFALMGHVSEEDYPETMFEGVLLPEERLWLAGCPHMPSAVAGVCSEAIRALNLSGYMQWSADQQIMMYHERVGATERLMRQPIPVAYTRLTIAVAPLMGFLLIGVENIGVQIEQPMKRLPLLALSLTVKSSIEMVMEQQPGSKNMVAISVTSCKEQILRVAAAIARGKEQGPKERSSTDLAHASSTSSSSFKAFGVASAPPPRDEEEGPQGPRNESVLPPLMGAPPMLGTAGSRRTTRNRLQGTGSFRIPPPLDRRASRLEQQELQELQSTPMPWGLQRRASTDVAAQTYLHMNFAATAAEQGSPHDSQA
eukprot:jgi/Astpho2/8388/fgenesh1_pg.00122_%23_102_t